MNQPPASLFVGVTGASGARYAVRLLRALAEAGCELSLCLSDAGVAVAAHELELDVAGRAEVTAALLAAARAEARVYAPERPRGAGGQRQQLPRRRGDLPVLDVVGRPHRAGHDAHPHPPGR